MFVSFISFALVLSVSVSQPTGNDNVALKDQLVRSLTHVNEMLVDMENKIESERKVLSQIENNLNQTNRLRTLPDYGITDIWWPTNSTGETGTMVQQISTTSAATPGKYGNVTITIITTPSLFPRPQTMKTFATRPSDWHPSTESPFIADLKQNMVLNSHGYFTASVERFAGMVYTKDEAVTYPVVYHMVLLMKQHAQNGTFNSLGTDLLERLARKLAIFETATATRVKEQAGVLHVMLKIVDASISNDIKTVLKFYDNMFTKEEGEKLFESLEPFYLYPAGNITFIPIGEGILYAALTPYFKSEGTRKQRRLVQHILVAANSINPHFRAQTMSSLSLSNNSTKANRSMKVFAPLEGLSSCNSSASTAYRARNMRWSKDFDTDCIPQQKPTYVQMPAHQATRNDLNQAALPERKSMNYKKVVKHFLVKHPKLFRKIKRQYKHDKKNDHHRFSHTRKRHHNYRKRRGQHHRRERLYDRGQTRQRAYTESSYESESEKGETDSSESGAYYSENSEAHQQKNIHKVQRTQLDKIRLDKLKQHTQKQRNAQQNQWNLLKGPRLTTKPYQDDPQYLKQLAIRFLSNKLQRQNFYRNRRFNIPSLEEENCNHSQNFEDSMENDMLRKIREASSYIDEEDHLRNNLYDALRHGNMTFASFRKSGGDINNKQTLRALSSETDEEWVLKNNIYKVFEQEKK